MNRLSLSHSISINHRLRYTVTNSGEQNVALYRGWAVEMATGEVHSNKIHISKRVLCYATLRGPSISCTATFDPPLQHYI